MASRESFGFSGFACFTAASDGFLSIATCGSCGDVSCGDGDPGVVANTEVFGETIAGCTVGLEVLRLELAGVPGGVEDLRVQSFSAERNALALRPEAP